MSDQREPPDGAGPTRLPPTSGPGWRSPERANHFPDEPGCLDTMGTEIRKGDYVVIVGGFYGRPIEAVKALEERGLLVGDLGAVMGYDYGRVIPFVFFLQASATVYVRPEDLLVVEQVPS